MQDLVQAVHLPDGDQVGDTAAVHPDDVLPQQMLADVVVVGPREELQMGGAVAGTRERGVGVTDPARVVAHGLMQVAEPGRVAGAGELGGEVVQRPRLTSKRPRTPRRRPLLVARIVGWAAVMPHCGAAKINP